MASNSPIGFFDSGVGGTSIWREVVHRLPHENTIYLADSKNAPYGEKDTQTILDLSIKNTEVLLEKGCKLIVVACNTATTNAIDKLREIYAIPFIGIEPAIKPAALGTKSGAVGILATKGTLSSSLFARTSSVFASNIKVIETMGTGLVELIEAGKTNSMETRMLLEKLIAPMIERKIDQLVLGCTHYPYLIPILKELLPPSVTIIDSGGAVARQTENILKSRKILGESQNARHTLYSNLDIEVLAQLTSDAAKNLRVEFLEF
ncbi:MAG: glutamate racemase [Cytophagaceae bacterium]|nr:glutamate racemase [Cytophagaceae bacterium]|tara:strand:- start:426 stop:1214 length:789 start_codon:yes stop_codon:yes gene_type:complete